MSRQLITVSEFSRKEDAEKIRRWMEHKPQIKKTAEWTLGKLARGEYREPDDFKMR